MPGRLGEQGPQREKRTKPGAQGRQPNLRTSEASREDGLGLGRCLLEHEAISFFLFSHQHWLDTEPGPAPWEDGTINHRKYTPKGSLCWHRHISWRSSLYQAFPIHYLFSAWQWPHVAVGSERLHNILRVSELARNSEIWTWIYQRLKNALSIVHHGACPPVTISLSKSAGGPQVYFQWQHLSGRNFP